MEVVMPMANSTGTSAMDSYEDMFKEITRKLYGEDGLPDIISNEKLGGSTATEIRLSSMDYEVDSNVFKSDEHITALGLAALMQNGFSSGGMLNSTFQPKQNIPEDKWITNEDNLQWTQSKIASYNPSQKLFKCADCDCVGFLLRVAEHWLGTHANLRVFQCPQCPYASAWARCVRMHVARQHNVISEEALDKHLKDNPVMLEIMRYLQELKSKYEVVYTKNQAPSPPLPENIKTSMGSPTRVNNSPSDNSARNSSLAAKRYSCNYCPYATDRRDLFTRHENIHREEKPFQCYVCQKQFNRADHVKKHFLRMHREHPYDLNRIRRQPPKNASGMSYYHKYNNDTPTMSNALDQSINVQQGIQNQLTIPNGFRQNTVSPAKPINNPVPKAPLMKLNPSLKSTCKKKGDKRYTCCYCSWSGVDNWCLKRHLNTHLKPFVCGLCDYKAARSERLATHVLKVHNKRACGRCLYLADDQAQLALHQQEHHSLENKNKSSNNVVRSASYTGNQNPSTHTLSQSLTPVSQTLKTYDISAAILQHGSRLLPMTSNFLSSTNSKPWKSYTPKQHGAARLFNYMEASDGSDNESEQNTNQDRNMNSSNKNLDFFEAGDVGLQNTGEHDDVEEDTELPLFICRECGCEFIDDISLDTHMLVHHHAEKLPASPKIKNTNKKLVSPKKHAKLNTLNKHTDSKENLKPKTDYICVVCKVNFNNQINIMNHMKTHTSNKVKENANKKVCSKKGNENYEDSNMNYHNVNGTLKRSRKQSQPRKVVPPFYESQEIQVMKGTSLKHRQWKYQSESTSVVAKLREKYMNKLINRKGYYCNLCKKSNSFFPYHTKYSLTNHYMFKHYGVKKYKCEHCPMKFRHQYQVVLHSSRKHVFKPSEDQLGENQLEIDRTVPKMNNKQTLLCGIPSAIENNDALISSNVPDNSTCVDKLNISSYLDQTLINTNGSQHMPITIPTFPPT